MSRRGLADLHIHTTYSDGWPTPRDVVDHAAAETALDVIAITDHDTIEGALRAAEYAARTSALRVVIGEEVSSRQGHILGLFLTNRIRPGLTAAHTVDLIHAQGGVAIAAHPFWRTQRLTRRRRRRVVHGVGYLAGELEFDAIEVENSTPGMALPNLLARRLAEATGITQVGGSDGHILDAIGRGATSFLGTTPRALMTALLNGRTRPEKRRYTSLGLVRYMAWGLLHERPRELAAAQ